MHELLVIENGPTIELLGRPAQGTRHDVRYGVMTDTAEAVVVKLERTVGALERERAALAALAPLSSPDSPTPRLLAAGTTTIDGERCACLVTERRAGAPPTTADGWRRMGGALARLGDLRPPLSGLPVLDGITFGHRHAQRVSDLGDRLAPLAASTTDWAHLISPQTPAAPLVITHGDPGPGNYLDDRAHGTLIDWEAAQIAPRGLDLARLVFIARLGAGPGGYPARDHRARAEAAVDGYLRSLRDRRQPSRRESRWWTTVAGVQFIHLRWELGGRPAPWQDAADVLQTALDDDLEWSLRSRASSPAR